MIDGQHKELIDKINDLFEGPCAEREPHPSRRRAAQMLNYLADYTEFHFGEEEKLQESSTIRVSRSIKRSMTSCAR